MLQAKFNNSRHTAAAPTANKTDSPKRSGLMKSTVSGSRVHNWGISSGSHLALGCLVLLDDIGLYPATAVNLQALVESPLTNLFSARTSVAWFAV
jgi:hypothetical protein